MKPLLAFVCLILVGCGGSQGTDSQDTSSPPIQSAPLSIMLIGDSSLEITQGETFDDPGVSVSGGQGDTSAIEITGEIGSFPGLYTLTYTATDASGSIDSETFFLQFTGSCCLAKCSVSIPAMCA